MLRLALSVAALAGLITACGSSGGSTPFEGSGPAGPPLVVTCSAIVPGAGAAADKRVIEERAAGMTPSAVDVNVAGDRITVTIPSPLPSADATALCQSGSLEFRGLIAPAQPVTCSNDCVADPFSSVIDTDPSLRSLLEPSTTALNAEDCPSPAMPQLSGQPAPCHDFASLSAGQQQDVLAALQKYDCSATQAEADVPSSYDIACDATGFVFLLGHVIANGSQIIDATADKPDPSTGRTAWTVTLTLDGAGTDAWHTWTSEYNTEESGSPLQTGSTPPCGASASVLCSDFVAFVLNRSVLTYPVTHAALGSTTQISGGFTEQTANRLALELSTGALPVPLKTESVTH